MCVLFLAIQQHTNYPFIMAHNRDEFYQRPTAPLGFWKDFPNLLAGKDLESGGTWLGITRSGRIAALTNYRDPKAHQRGKISRGHLILQFLQEKSSPQAFLKRLQQNQEKYNPFNLFLGELKKPSYFSFYSSHDSKIEKIPPGLYGLSNGLLEAPWPKVRIGKALFQHYLETHSFDLPFNELCHMMQHSKQAKDEELPNTGIGIELERALSPLFIETKAYGTRSTSLVTLNTKGEIGFSERTYRKGRQNFEDRGYRTSTD